MQEPVLIEPRATLSAAASLPALCAAQRTALLLRRPRFRDGTLGKYIGCPAGLFYRTCAILVFFDFHFDRLLIFT